MRLLLVLILTSLLALALGASEVLAQGLSGLEQEFGKFADGPRHFEELENVFIGPVCVFVRFMMYLGAAAGVFGGLYAFYKAAKGDSSEWFKGFILLIAAGICIAPNSVLSTFGMSSMSGTMERLSACFTQGSSSAASSANFSSYALVPGIVVSFATCPGGESLEDQDELPHLRPEEGRADPGLAQPIAAREEPAPSGAPT